MFIRAYLRASTEEQNSARAKDEIVRFAERYGLKIASFYIENISGTKLSRPELNRLLNDSSEGDVILIEQIDRLTRLSFEDWELLKAEIRGRKLSVVSLDLPTTWETLRGRGENEEITALMLRLLNGMMIDMMAVMSRKDWETRRKRQKQGIEHAKRLGKYKGRQADLDKHAKILYFRNEKGLTLSETAAAVGCCRAQVCKILKEHKEKDGK